MNIVTGITCSNCGVARPEEPGPCRRCGDSRRTFAAAIHEQVRVAAAMTTATTRGPQTWAYIYMVAGLLLTIAIAVVSVLDIPGWAKAIAIVCVAIILLVALADSGRVHNWLLRVKRAYEDKAR